MASNLVIISNELRRDEGNKHILNKIYKKLQTQTNNNKWKKALIIPVLMENYTSNLLPFF
jgi:hypothetical protein